MSRFIPSKNVKREQHMQLVRIQNRKRAMQALADQIAESNGLEKIELSKAKEGKTDE